MGGDIDPHTLNFIISESIVQLHAATIYLPGTHMTGCMAGPTTSPDTVEKRTNTRPHQEPNLVSQTSSQQLQSLSTNSSTYYIKVLREFNQSQCMEKII